MNAEEIARSKKEYTHTKINELADGCPIGQSIPHACFDCTYTDIIGMCVHPIDIQTEIFAGRAQPMRHDPSFPELEADRKRQAEARAFRAVDKR
jgi:hypothetical protein